MPQSHNIIVFKVVAFIVELSLKKHKDFVKFLIFCGETNYIKDIFSYIVVKIILLGLAKNLKYCNYFFNYSIFVLEITLELF